MDDTHSRARQEAQMMAQPLPNPPPAPILLSISTSSTDDIETMCTVVTPEGCTLVHDSSGDNLNPLSRRGFDHKVSNFPPASEPFISSSQNDGNYVNDNNDAGVTMDALTIDIKSILEPNEPFIADCPVHVISPIGSTPVCMNASSEESNAALSPRPMDSSQTPINTDEDTTNGDVTPLRHTLNSQEACVSPPYSSPSSSSNSSHPLEPPPPPPPPPSSAAQEALITFRSTKPTDHAPSLPPPITRGVSLDSSSQYPHHLNNNTRVLDDLERTGNNSDNEFSFHSEATSSDGEGSYFSEHLPSPKSAARHSMYGNRLPPGNSGNSGGGHSHHGPQSWMNPGPRGNWNRSGGGSSSSIGGGGRSGPCPSNNLDDQLRHPKYGQESDLSVSSSSGGDDGSVSTLGSAYPLSRTNSAPSPFTTSNNYRSGISNTGYGAVGEIFRNPHRPPMMPVLQQQGSHNNGNSNQSSGRDTPPPMPRTDSIETADDLLLSLTNTPSSHATSSNGNSNSKSNAMHTRILSTTGSMVSSSSEDCGLPSLESSCNGRDVQKNGGTIASVPIVNVVRKVGLQPNDNRRNRNMVTTDNNCENNTSKNINKKLHRRQGSYRSVGSVGGSIASGYRPDSIERKQKQLQKQQQQEPHKRSNQIRNPPPDESDCDTIASEITVDTTNHYDGNRARSHSDFAEKGRSHNKTGGHNVSRVPLEVKTSSLGTSRKVSEGRGPQQSGGSMEDRENELSPVKNNMTEKQMKIWRTRQLSNSPNRPPHSPASSDKLELIDSSPDRRLIRKESMEKSTGSILVYSEDDTDESSRFREMTAVAEDANRNACVGGVGNGERSNLSSSGRVTPEDMVIQTYSPASDIHSRTVEKAEQVVSSQSGEYDTSGATSMLQQSTVIPLHQTYSKGGNIEYVNNPPPDEYKVYAKRWIMLFWMSLLNLLSDWTCYSIAPISVLAKQKFNGAVNPEALVTLFLASNAVATALEPSVLARLGLRRTIVFGSFLLMVGNIIKSGGIPGLTDTPVDDEQGWRIYTGFLLVGLSQPLYQCTPALLSSSWFADKERTLATGVALNANQVGIGLSFIIGTTMVASGDDISTYFNLLSVLSILAFVGCFFQFKDAPPTPPSGSARIMRGSLEVNLGLEYGMDYVRQSMSMGGLRSGCTARPSRSTNHGQTPHPSLRRLESSSNGSSSSRQSSAGCRSKKDASIGQSRRTSSGGKYKKSRSSSKSSSKGSDHRQRNNSPVNMLLPSSSKHNQQSKNINRSSSSGRERGSRHVRQNSGGSGARHRSSRKGSGRSASSENGFGDNPIGPSPTSGMESTADCQRQIKSLEEEAASYGAIAPSSMMSSEPQGYRHRRHENNTSYYDTSEQIPNWHHNDNNRRDRHVEWQQQLQAAYISGHGERHNVPRGGNWSQREQYYEGQHYDMSPNEIIGNVGGGYPPDTPFTTLRHEHPDPSSTTRGGKMTHNHYQHSYAPYQYGNTVPVPVPVPIHPYLSQYQYQVPPSSWQGADSYYNYQQSSGAGQYHRQGAYLEHPTPIIPHPSNQLPPPESEVDVGAEPIVTQMEGRTLNIEIRDDQVLQSIKACFSRPGFVHAVVAFAVGGVVINTLSTYMDYLVQLGGSDRTTVGIIGFFFQMLIMMSGMIVGKITDRTREYYYVLLGLLVLGAMILAECGVHLDAEQGVSLRWSLLGAAVMIGPLQPVATELGVDV